MHELRSFFGGLHAARWLRGHRAVFTEGITGAFIPLLQDPVIFPWGFRRADFLHGDLGVSTRPVLESRALLATPRLYFYWWKEWYYWAIEALVDWLHAPFPPQREESGMGNGAVAEERSVVLAAIKPSIWAWMKQMLIMVMTYLV